MMDDEDRPGPGIRAYAQRLMDLPGPAGDGAKMAAGGLTVGAGANQQRQPLQQPSASPGGAVSTDQKGLAVSPGGAGALGAGALSAAGGLTVNPLKTSATSQPGISKVTGAGLSSPLYTNEGDAGQAVAGIGQRMASTGITTAPASDAKPAFGPAAGLTITPFGGVNAAGVQNEGLARMARANAITQERIDAQPRGGAAVLGGLDAQGRTRQEQENDARSARWRQDELISQAKYLPQMAGIASNLIQGDSQQAVEGLRQQGIAAGINTERRGQDLGYGAKMAQIGLTARGQDQDAAMGGAKLGIDMARFGLEQSTMQRQQSAQDNLARAMESGDQNAIARARAMATMAGVKVPESTKLETVQTDSGLLVFNPASGEMRPAVGAGGQPVGSGKPLTEGQAKAAGFGMRAAESSKIIEQVGQGGKVQPSLIKRAAESVPLIGEGLGMVANQFASPEQQQIEQAQRDFINAILRQESGAVIADSEFANARKQYFPAPGDSQEVIEQKQRNREMAINGFRVTAGPAAKNIGNPPAQKQAPQQSVAAPAVGTVDGGFVFLGGNPNDQANWMEVRK